MEISTTPELVSNVYSKLTKNIAKFRDVVGRPLTLTEKILSGHLNEINETNFSGERIMFF
jgi:aconitase (EC 4.2.1.3)